MSRFRDAGLVTLGRTNSPELGSVPVTEPVAYGADAQPVEHRPGAGRIERRGGRRGRAGMVPIAHASTAAARSGSPPPAADSSGSSRHRDGSRSARCGTESGLSVELCVSRSVRDTARLLDAVHGPGVGDTVIAPPPARP